MGTDSHAVIAPPAAIFLIWRALVRRPWPGLAKVALALLLLGLLDSMALSGAILFGFTRDDWWLPLV